MRAGGRWQAAAEHVGKVDAAFFDHRTVFDHTGATAAAGWPGPGVFDKACVRLEGFQGAANAVLQVKQIGLYSLGAGSHGITLNRAKLREAIGRRRQMGAQDTTALRCATVDEDQA
jgi:hypothetical protein